MKKAYITSLFIFLFSLQNSLHASKEIIHCSHSEICALASKVLNEELVEFRSVVTIVGDPHEFVPRSDSIKKLMDAKILISGPNALNPWMNKINEHRIEKNEKKTLLLTTLPKFTSIYPQASSEALAHFWLYPNIYCSHLTQLFQELEKNKLSHLLKVSRLSPEKCLESAKKIEVSFYEAVSKLRYPIVLTHDALYAYILKANPDPLKILAIKGSGHHEEASPLSIKKLYQLLKNKKIIWLEEKGIHVPANILNKKRKEDFVITLDTAQSMNNPHDHIISQTLLEFISKLNEISP